MQPDSAPKPVRCAIYTRKSTEEGLEQDFNSLDAQRESAEAYILSQRHEQWMAVAERYDDGGFTGANTERPALQKLLTDVQAGKIDCVVVYKVDRLSRSLLDFSRIMEVLDQRGVSFISVTQQFNTTSSMGRLTLNILFSFAQFEREIISERTRDKMVAARRKGKWTGGYPALGYDPDPLTRRLVVNEQEAERVRAIFATFLKTGSLSETLAEIDRRGWKTKSWKTQKSREREGKPFDRPALVRVLTNVLYIGEVGHGGQRYPGEQPAIVEREVWSEVAELVQSRQRSTRGKQRRRESPLLEGRLECAICGNQMVHGYTTKGGRRYRYYLCQTARKGGARTCPKQTVGARRIEQVVMARLLELAQPTIAPELAQEQHAIVDRWIEQIRYDHRTEQASIRWRAGADETAVDAAITVRKDPSGKRYAMKRPAAQETKLPAIAQRMALALRFEQLIEDGVVQNYPELARRVGVSTVRVSQILKLRNLAPTIQERLLAQNAEEAYLPELALRRISDELDWGRQREMFRALVEAGSSAAAERNAPD